MSVIPEEVIHLHPRKSSLALRARMQTLGEDKLARWHELAPQQKLAMHVDRVEVEADAQRQIIWHRSGSEDDPDAVIRILDAEEALLLTNERLAQLKVRKSHGRIVRGIRPVREVFSVRDARHGPARGFRRTPFPRCNRFGRG